MALYPYEFYPESIQGSDLKRINGLLKELSPDSHPISLSELKEILETSYMTVLRDGRKAIVGMATLVVCRKPSGRFGLVEDVVVSTRCRGQGGGRQLMKGIISEARQMKLKNLNLTSRPERVEANKLYVSLGFEKPTTNYYRLKL